MKQKIIIRRRRLPLVAIEMNLTSLLVSIWLKSKFHWDWPAGFLAFIICLILLAVLFFRIRVMRYIFSILFSLAWAIIAFAIFHSLAKEHIARWIAAALAFVGSLILHKRYFQFETSAVEVKHENR